MPTALHSGRRSPRNVLAAWKTKGPGKCQAPSVIRMEAAFYRTRWLPFQSVLTAVRSVPLTDELVSVNVRTECAMASDI
jgi:hypothetical protein